ncbi:MAG: BlaI/MecI/CopY family transcriptional regulator [Alphaproteobacteria bacterium]|nr:BlaI/MecI/CopY family transcriptional regulator [Alphaproteobacteria bacterium]
MADFSRREREIMDALFAAGEADAEQIRASLKNPPGYDSVRTTLRILESKGHVRHRVDGRRHVYKPAQNRAAALKGAWRNLVNTYFAGSQEAAAAALFDPADLDEKKLDLLLTEIESAPVRRKSRK